jgi:hypothetical protein
MFTKCSPVFTELFTWLEYFVLQKFNLIHFIGERRQTMKTAKSLSWLVALAGLWEVLAPFILGYPTVAMWNAIIVGVVLIVLAAWAALSEQVSLDRNLDGITMGLGLWLILAPFIPTYSTTVAARLNDIIVGVVVIVLAGWAATTFGKPAAPQM